MAHGYEGSLVRLVPIDLDKHLENCYRWLNDTDVTDTLSIGDFPIPLGAEREWLEKLSKQVGGSDVIFAVETLDGRHVGQSGLHQIDFRNQQATTGSFIGNKEDRGLGYGTDAARVRAKYVFHTLGLRQVFSVYLEGNEASARMQAKAGYEVWGVKPKSIWKNGAYRDEIQTVLTKERWLSFIE
jgi:RimJ/RimL family protein N-acetyltransferase